MSITTITKRRVEQYTKFEWITSASGSGQDAKKIHWRWQDGKMWTKGGI
jgi:hypothetical protein